MRAMELRSRLFLAVLVLCGSGEAVRGSEEVVIRLEVVQPPARMVEDAGGTRAEISVLPGTETVPVEVAVVIETRIEPCASSPEECGENFRQVESGGSVIYGCLDRADNDGDGVTDMQDPGCTGVQGWSMAVEVDESLHLYPDPNGAIVLGTFADDDTRPPGLADREGGIFRYQNVVDPARNGGRRGVAGVCTLSFMHPVWLPPVGSFPVMRIRGDLDVSGLEAGGSSLLCRLDVQGPGEEGLTLMLDPITTITTVRGQSYSHSTRDLTITATVAESAPFKRGNVNGDANLDVSDGVYILNFLFLGGDRPECLDSADADDNGSLTITDGIAVFGFLFFGFDALPAPGPYTCGPDGTPDGIFCAQFTGC